ncbi:hypothetical protein [Ruegeria arenilitoris]|uniref:hypothetical protein n=1 Tax=Ruegeria arenilitoris TaxID=1173585 RepID=UPI001479BD4E|nr:hypothetical protein [Ruegeria arenilitoris]
MSQVYEIGGLYLRRNSDGSFVVINDNEQAAAPFDFDDEEAVKCALISVSIALQELRSEKNHLEQLRLEGLISEYSLRRRQRRLDDGIEKARSKNEIKSEAAWAEAARLWPKALSDSGHNKDRARGLLKLRLDSWQTEDLENRRTLALSTLSKRF